MYAPTSTTYYYDRICLKQIQLPDTYDLGKRKSCFKSYINCRCMFNINENELHYMSHQRQRR
jgi:hypothetical protein